MALKDYQISACGDAGAILQMACHQASYDAGWWLGPTMPPESDPHRADYVQFIRQAMTPGDRYIAKAIIAQKLALVHSEISEGLEGSRKDKMDDHLPHRKSIEVELADAVIRIADLAGALNLDLGGAIAEKLAYNAQREDHKLENRAKDGGKAF